MSYPDCTDPEVLNGVAWAPTATLRFVERRISKPAPAHGRTARILQQQWETVIVNRTGYMIHIENPGLTEWRDVPLETEGK